VTPPTADDFRALARSSPWLWTTLRFTVRWGGPWPTRPEPLRGWIRRPGALRVETLTGELVQAWQERGATVGILTSDGGRAIELPRPPLPGAPEPVRRPDGLVARRPDQLHRSPGMDDPMFQNYRWVAMLDPVELADGRDREYGDPAGPGLEIDEVAVTEHAGRPAWEAVVRTTPVYEPRCGCCPLLRSREVDEAEYGDDRPEILLAAYPEAYRVRLDLQTGVCVLTEALGGSPVATHDLRIGAVDEPMDDDLFVQPRRGFLGRRSGWSSLQ
jgi:hypothetical protein